MDVEGRRTFIGGFRQICRFAGEGLGRPAGQGQVRWICSVLSMPCPSQPQIYLILVRCQISLGALTFSL